MFLLKKKYRKFSPFCGKKESLKCLDDKQNGGKQKHTKELEKIKQK